MHRNLPLARHSTAARWLVLGLVLAIYSMTGGCALPVAVVHYADVDQFARNMFRIAHEDDAREWGTLLTAARRAQGSTYVREHFGRWQQLILDIEEGPYAGDLSIAKFRVNDGALEFETEGEWVHIIRVEMEDGGWKINQD